MAIGFKAALFDMDGTLTHTMRYWRIAPLEFALAHNIILKPEEYERLYLTSSRTMVREICAKHSLVIPDEVIQTELETFVYHHYLFDAVPYDNAERFLRILKNKGIPAALATGSPKENADALMNRLNFTQYFRFITGGYDLPVTKRDACYFSVMSEKLGVQPEEMCVFEDALYSILNAKKAGCRVVAIEDPTQAKDREAIQKACDLYVTGYDELCTQLENETLLSR